jgi:hypothetical protein
MDNYLALLNHMMQHLDEELATTQSRLEALDPLDILYVIQMRGLDWVRTYTPNVMDGDTVKAVTPVRLTAAQVFTAEAALGLCRNDNIVDDEGNVAFPVPLREALERNIVQLTELKARINTEMNAPSYAD